MVLCLSRETAWEQAFPGKIFPVYICRYQYFSRLLRAGKKLSCKRKNLLPYFYSKDLREIGTFHQGNPCVSAFLPFAEWENRRCSPKKILIDDLTGHFFFVGELTKVPISPRIRVREIGTYPPKSLVYRDFTFVKTEISTPLSSADRSQRNISRRFFSCRAKTGGIPVTQAFPVSFRETRTRFIIFIIPGEH